jgi:hypothetical protein
VPVVSSINVLEPCSAQERKPGLTEPGLFGSAPLASAGCSQIGSSRRATRHENHPCSQPPRTPSPGSSLMSSSRAPSRNLAQAPRAVGSGTCRLASDESQEATCRPGWQERGSSFNCARGWLSTSLGMTGVRGGYPWNPSGNVPISPCRDLPCERRPSDRRVDRDRPVASDWPRHGFGAQQCATTG